MVEPGQPPPVRHRLIDRVAGRGGAEALAVARAEAPDAVLVEQGLGGGQEGEAAFLVAGGALGRRIEAAHALDLVAEEVEPQPLALARREEVDDSAAHRIFAGILDGVGAVVAVGAEQGRQFRHVDPLARRETGDELADPERGQGALGRGVDGGDEKLRPGRLALKRVEGRQPLRRGAQRRRGPVVGQAVPGREGEHLELGREIGRRVLEMPHRRLVGRDEHRPALRGAREVRGEPGQEARGRSGQGHRPLRGEDLVEVGHYSGCLI